MLSNQSINSFQYNKIDGNKYVVKVNNQLVQNEKKEEFFKNLAFIFKNNDLDEIKELTVIHHQSEIIHPRDFYLSLNKFLEDDLLEDCMDIYIKSHRTHEYNNLKKLGKLN